MWRNHAFSKRNMVTGRGGGGGGGGRVSRIRGRGLHKIEGSGTLKIQNTKIC